MKTILLTGFEPFDGERRNPSREIALGLDGDSVAGHRIVGAELPVLYDVSAERLFALMALHAPRLVVCLGVARGRAKITPERLARNLDDARIPDNAGAVRRNQPIVPGGPLVLPSTLPVEALSAALERAGIPAEPSDSAGAFVCNHLFYRLMDTLAAMPSAPRGGFVHLPAITEEWTVERMRAGVRGALAGALSD